FLDSIDRLRDRALEKSERIIFFCRWQTRECGAVSAPDVFGGGGRRSLARIQMRISPDPVRIVAQECGGQMAIDKAPGRKAQPEIMHENGAWFPGAEKSQGQLERAKILRAVD
ncbi:MAG: hypothetical protein ABJB22_01800, partial [Verrucomicrobiota bacterium]